jgi:hypothetical protein
VYVCTYITTVFPHKTLRMFPSSFLFYELLQTVLELSLKDLLRFCRFSVHFGSYVSKPSVRLVMSTRPSANNNIFVPPRSFRRCRCFLLFSASYCRKDWSQSWSDKTWNTALLIQELSRSLHHLRDDSIHRHSNDISKYPNDRRSPANRWSPMREQTGDQLVILALW